MLLGANTFQEAATNKAIKLVRAGIARTALSLPLSRLRVDTYPSVLIIGAGVAGYAPLWLYQTWAFQSTSSSRQNSREAWSANGARCSPKVKKGSDIIGLLLDRVRERENISLFTGSRIVEKSGNVGKFSVKISVSSGDLISLTVGGIIVTTGFLPYQPPDGDFGYGLDGVITLPQYEEMLAGANGTLKYNGKEINTVTYIYCVGSREHLKEENAHTYCSATAALQRYTQL
jgi:heterodisulfide reductase subunit A